MPIFMHIHSRRRASPSQCASGREDRMEGRQAGGAAVIPCRKLYQRNTSAKLETRVRPRHLSRRPFSDSHWPRPPQCGQLAARPQLQLPGRSSVRGWTRQWLFGTYTPLAPSPHKPGGLLREERCLWRTLSLPSRALIQSPWQASGVPLSTRPSNLCVIEFPISHPSIMHLVPCGRKQASRLPPPPPSAQRKETGFWSGWTHRSTTSWRSLNTLLRAASAAWRQTASIQGLLCSCKSHHRQPVCFHGWKKYIGFCKKKWKKKTSKSHRGEVNVMCVLFTAEFEENSPLFAVCITSIGQQIMVHKSKISSTKNMTWSMFE